MGGAWDEYSMTDDGREEEGRETGDDVWSSSLGQLG